MYNDGEPYSAIAKILHTKQDKVSKHLKELGYGIRPKNKLKNRDALSKSRKYIFNFNYFEEINSDEKAYWLGFLFADGYVCKRNDSKGHEKGGSIEISLKKDDEYHIRNFLDDISSNIKISHRKIKLDNKEYEASRAIICSIKMVDDLIKHGCTQNKSLTLVPPSIEDKYISHFIRGYFDGDGCVAFYPEYRSFCYSIIGTKEILEFIKDKAEVPNNSIRGFDHKKCYELRITSKDDIKTFHNYIYRDKTIYLQRKYDKSLQMMKFQNLEDCRTTVQKMADLLD